MAKNTKPDTLRALVALKKEFDVSWRAKLEAVENRMENNSLTISKEVKKTKTGKALKDRPQYQQQFNKVLKEFINDGYLGVTKEESIDRLVNSVYSEGYNGQGNPRLSQNYSGAGTNGEGKKKFLYSSKGSARSAIVSYINRNKNPLSENMVAILKCLMSEAWSHSLSRNYKRIPNKQLVANLMEILDTKALRKYVT